MKFLLIAIPAAGLFANPVGGLIVSGSACFSEPLPGVLEIEATSQTILEWQDFSIAEGECTRFQLPDSRAALLNRVSSQQSRIDGRLESNGQIFLVNPQGIVIGKEGIVDTQSFIASALPISDALFLAGDFRFEGEGGAVSNAGFLNAPEGAVALVGRFVENSGAIAAQQARLLAGGEVWLRLDGEPAFIAVSAKRLGEMGIANEGTIRAQAIELAADGGAYSLAVNQTGWLDAGELVSEGGRILLTAPNGAIEAAGRLKANGLEKGGQISLSAETAYLYPDAVVEAEGNEQGGAIAIMAEECFSYGTLLAGGGAIGGQIEVSGRQALDFRGSASASGEKAGTLLIDPADIEIGTAPTTPPPFAFPPSHPLYDRPGPTAQLNSLDLLSQLTHGTSVTVRTSPGAGGPNGGRITVSAPLEWGGAETNLKLVADENIVILANISNLSRGDVALSAGQDVLIQSSPAAPVAVASLGILEILAGNLEIQSVGNPAEAGSLDSNLNLSLSGNLLLSAGAGEIPSCRARLGGQSVTAQILGNVEIYGGDGIDCLAEIGHLQPGGPMDITIGGNLQITGGMASGARAAISAGQQLTLDVGGSAALISGTGGEARIASRNGGILASVGTAGMADLAMTGDLSGGPALIEANGDIAINGSRDAILNFSQIVSRSGSAQIAVSGDLSAAAQCELSAPFSFAVIAANGILNQSQLFASNGSLSLTGGNFSFLNNSALAAFSSVNFMGTSLSFNQSAAQGHGAWAVSASGAVSFLNSSSMNGPIDLALSSASLTISQSSLSIRALSAALSGALQIQNNGSLRAETMAAIAAGSASLVSGAITGMDLGLFCSGACSLLNLSSIEARRSASLSGTALAMDNSAVRSMESTLSIAFTGAANLLNGSQISCPSNLSFSSGAWLADQSAVQSLSGAISVAAAGILSLTNQSLLAGAEITLTAPQLDLDFSSIQGSYVQLGLAGPVTLLNGSAIEGFGSLGLSTPGLCSLDASALRGAQIALNALALQMNLSSIQASQKFNVLAPTLTLTGSVISDPESTLSAP